jgi:hypothetical protein
MPSRRFAPPWSIEDIGAAFVVKDSSGQKLAYSVMRKSPAIVSQATHQGRGAADHDTLLQAPEFMTIVAEQIFEKADSIVHRGS